RASHAWYLSLAERAPCGRIPYDCRDHGPQGADGDGQQHFGNYQIPPAASSFDQLPQGWVELHPYIVHAGMLTMTAFAGLVGKGGRRRLYLRWIGRIGEDIIGPRRRLSVGPGGVLHRYFKPDPFAIEGAVREDALRLLIGGREV